MPHIYQTWEGTEARTIAAKHPFGMGLGKNQAAKVERLELEVSSFSDPGPDWEKWHAYDASGAEIATRVVDAY